MYDWKQEDPYKLIDRSCVTAASQIMALPIKAPWPNSTAWVFDRRKTVHEFVGKGNLVHPEVVQMDPNASTLTCWRRKGNSE